MWRGRVFRVLEVVESVVLKVTYSSLAFCFFANEVYIKQRRRVDGLMSRLFHFPVFIFLYGFVYGFKFLKLQ